MMSCPRCSYPTLLWNPARISWYRQQIDRCCCTKAILMVRLCLFYGAQHLNRNNPALPCCPSSYQIFLSHPKSSSLSSFIATEKDPQSVFNGLIKPEPLSRFCNDQMALLAQRLRCQTVRGLIIGLIYPQTPPGCDPHQPSSVVGAKVQQH